VHLLVAMYFEKVLVKYNLNFEWSVKILTMGICPFICGGPVDDGASEGRSCLFP
jgi:hypothetical protein